jgi:hypothetical protein
VSAEHVATAISFWEQALIGGNPEDLTGFGWYAEIGHMDGTTWNGLTRQTLNITRGSIDQARRVADRAASQEPTPDTLEILNLLLRGLQDGWDHWNILSTASRTIKGAESLSAAPEYQRLRTSLLERGVDLGRPSTVDDPEPPADLNQDQ